MCAAIRSPAISALFAVPEVEVPERRMVNGTGRRRTLLFDAGQDPVYKVRHCIRPGCGKVIRRESCRTLRAYSIRSYCCVACRIADVGARRQLKRIRLELEAVKVCLACGQDYHRRRGESVGRFELRVTCGRLCPSADSEVAREIRRERGRRSFQARRAQGWSTEDAGS
jgi:hypothetical protein